MVVRFGAINDRKANCLDILKESFQGTSWNIDNILSAGDASVGRRQAYHFRGKQKPALEEYDIYATLAC